MLYILSVYIIHINIDCYDGTIAADILQDNVDLIKEKQLNVLYLANKMVSCGILNESDKDSITGCGGVEGTNYLIDILIASVRSDGAMFGHFIDIIKEEGSDKAKKLAEELIICYISII